MGEFLNKSRQDSNRSQNLHQSKTASPEQNAVQKAEVAPEEEVLQEKAFSDVFQRKWDGDEGGEEKNKPSGPVPQMMEEEEAPVQRYGPVPVQFNAPDQEEEPVQRKGPVPVMNSDVEEPVQRYGPVPMQLQASEEEEPLQRKGPVPSMEQDSEIPVQRKGPVPTMNHTEETSQNDSASSSDKMPFLVQRKMESSFGEDFSNVNIHQDSSQSKELNAHAHTKGSDIHFAPGMYNPESQKGQELLGHELTHVVQQREGRVQPTVQKKGVNINDDEGLEKEADEMGEKAARGAEVGTVQRVSDDGIQLKALEADKIDGYFKDYEKFAQDQLDHWYSKTTVADDEKLTGAMFSKAAKKVYDEKKDLSFVVPVEYALAQARLEGGLMGKERTEGNIFNVGAFDSGVTSTEQGINDKEKGFDAYYKLMSQSFLNNKTADALLENGNFTTKSGGVYATNPFYEIEIKAEVGLMHYRDSEYALSGTVGKGKKNGATDVEIVGGLLAQLGYITKDKAADADAVCAAILEFQTKELAPEDEEWFKKRMDLVTNATDKANMKIKLKNNKDGIIGKEGTTIGLLYFKTILSSKIPDLQGSENTKEESTGVEAVVNNASVTSSTSATPGTTIVAPSDVKVGVKDGQPIGSKADIIKVQKSLKALGYYHGTADGIITRKDGSESDTVKAIKKFQKDHQLSESGNIDANTDSELVKAVAALPAAPAVKAPVVKATTKTTAPVNNNTKPAVKPETVSVKSAEQIYKLHGGEMLAIGKEMLAVSKSNPGLVIKMLDYLSWYEKDNLAYNLSSHLSESDLSSIDKKLVQRLYNELDSGYTSDTEQKQLDKLNKFLPKAEVAKEVVKETKKETKPAAQSSSLDMSGSVGKGGDNKAKDVLKIQNFLVNFNYLASSSEEITAVKTSNTQNPETKIDDKNLKDTIVAIKEYQKYGATTKASVASQDGKISKDKYTHTSMKEMDRIYNQYNDQKFEDVIANVLTDSQWRTQFRYGYNYRDGEDSKEKEYIDFVKDTTGYDDPADLHKASNDKIAKVKTEFAGATWWDSEGVKENSIRTSQKAREAKPNFVCCWDTASLMLGFSGASEKGENYKVQTFVKDTQSGKFTNQAELGVKYIDAQLKSGKAVFVGIEKGADKTINEGTTDHYIIIVGKGKDGDKWYYNYFDPGTIHKANGYNKDKNRLYIGSDKKTVENDKTKLSQIRVNNE